MRNVKFRRLSDYAETCFTFSDPFIRYNFVIMLHTLFYIKISIALTRQRCIFVAVVKQKQQHIWTIIKF